MKWNITRYRCVTAKYSISSCYNVPEDISRKFLFSTIQKATGDRGGGSGESGVNVRTASSQAKERRAGNAPGDVARFQEAAYGAAGGSYEDAKGTTNMISAKQFKLISPLAVE